jgi:methionyl-tRNA formyltransferase
VKVVLLTKADRFSQEAQAFALSLWPSLRIAQGAVGDPRPPALMASADVLISFLSPWIITADELARFDTAINFHPASTDYPGSGCYNFALYKEASEYGATCHHMLPNVDTGRVILERRFPVLAEDSVETLKLATMETMLGMFRDISALIARDEPLPKAPTHWTRKPYTFRELEALKVIAPDMPADEIARRLRATIYPGFPGPVMRHPDGTCLPFPMPKRPAVA